MRQELSEAALNSGKIEAIRRAATHVFATKGYHTATVSEIAKEAGVGKGTVYFYFASKEDVLLAILEHHFDQMVTLLERIEHLDTDPAEAARLVLRDIVRRLKEDPELFKIMEQQPLLYHERVKERFEESFRIMVDRTARLLQSGIDAGVLRSFDPQIAASVLLNTAASFPLYLSMHQDKPQDEVLDHLADEVGDLIWAALRNPRN